MSSSAASKSLVARAGAAALLLLCLAAGAALLAPLTTYPLGRDQGVFATVADVINQGGAPYRDAWDIKPPGIFYFFWLSFAVFGRSESAPRLLDLIWSLATAVGIWAVGRRLLSEGAGLAAGFFFLVRYITHDYYWHTTQCDGAAGLPLTLAALALTMAETNNRARWAALCGALVGAAVIIKFTLGVFILLPLGALILRSEQPRNLRVARAAAYLGGCAVVLAAVAALIWRAGALRDMVEIVFTWNGNYARHQPSAMLRQNVVSEVARQLVGNPAKFLFPVGLLAVIGLVDVCARPGSARLRWLCPAWALAIVGEVVIQGRYYSYHWLPLLPPVALLAAQGSRAVSAVLRRSVQPRTAAALSAFGLLALFALLGTGYYSFLRFPLRRLAGRIPREAYLRAFDRAILSDFSLSADHAVASWVRRHTEPGTPFFIWGFEPVIHFLAHRPPASRFIYNIPLVAPWSPPDWRAELVRELREKTPPYIIVVHRDPQPWMVGRWDDSATQLETYPELAQLLRESFQPCERIQDFDIWELKQDRPMRSAPGPAEERYSPM